MPPFMQKWCLTHPSNKLTMVLSTSNLFCHDCFFKNMVIYAILGYLSSQMECLTLGLELLKLCFEK